MTTDSVFDMLHGKGKPFGFVLLAVLIADSSDAVFKLISIGIGKIKTSERLPPIPQIDQWMPLYRNHREFYNALGSLLELPFDINVAGALDVLRDVSRSSEDQVTEIVEEMEEEGQKQFIQQFIGIPFPPDERLLRDILHDIDTDSTDDSDWTEVLYRSAVGQFFIRIWMPCWVLYRQLPGVLLRTARQGNHDALDKLLRLDKSVVRDPKIAQVWHEIMHNGSRSDQNRFKKAMADGPKVKLTDRTVKQGLAGLISQLAIQARSPVTGPEIRLLFDSIKNVRSGGIDTMMPETPEAMKKSIQSNRNWPAIPPG